METTWITVLLFFLVFHFARVMNWKRRQQQPTFRQALSHLLAGITHEIAAYAVLAIGIGLFIYGAFWCVGLKEIIIVMASFSFGIAGEWMIHPIDPHEE